jgi:hypothetical protein
VFTVLVFLLMAIACRAGWRWAYWVSLVVFSADGVFLIWAIPTWLNSHGVWASFALGTDLAGVALLSWFLYRALLAV